MLRSLVTWNFDVFPSLYQVFWGVFGKGETPPPGAPLTSSITKRSSSSLKRGLQECGRIPPNPLKLCGISSYSTKLEWSAAHSKKIGHQADLHVFHSPNDLNGPNGPYAPSPNATSPPSGSRIFMLTRSLFRDPMTRRMVRIAFAVCPSFPIILPMSSFDTFKVIRTPKSSTDRVISTCSG